VARRNGLGGRAAAHPPGGAGDDPDAASPHPEDPGVRARDICLRQLTSGPRTAAQLGEAMTRRGIAEEVVVEVLARFAAVGLIDDEAFAAAWVHSRHTGRGLARRALAHELRARGVDDVLVAVAVADLAPDVEAATARALAVRRLASMRGLDTAVRFRRVTGFLARKGYSPSLSYRVIREALEAEGTDPSVLDGVIAPGEE
jgi:regulatory protein